ncbi:hypothetical protein [Acanthopleuribacter pedis]|uniref:Uncharacterized protein n=1 Tax=Acanthopleuribacter pedis TaxID=442870 RepID=A0A8J7U4D2_9BACT|nr:hypothetical protein [Acanthopleuribacter pedis]MBO1319679.1 hypothetical protein [Acanthopleuribacter pedis]
MAKLYIPKDCVLEGALTKISYSGDIVIENSLSPQEVTSTGGGVVLHSSAESLTCAKISAATGIALRGQAVTATSVSGEEGEIEARDLQCHQLTLTDHLALKAETLRIHTLKAKSAVIEADRIEIDQLQIEGDLFLRGREVNVVECSAGKVQLSGMYQGERMTAVGGVHQEQGSITVRFLDTRTYSAEDHVRGMVAISTAEEVRAVGVRGFLRPDEFNILSGSNGMSMDLAVAKPMPMAPAAEDGSQAETEPQAFAEPTMSDETEATWLVEAEPVAKDPDILHHPNDPDQIDTRSVPTGELDLVTAAVDDAFVPTHEFVPPEPAAAAPPEEAEAPAEGAPEEEVEPEPEAAPDPEAGVDTAFSTNPAVEGEDEGAFEPAPEAEEAHWKSVEELPDSMQAAASAAEEMMEVANASVDGEDGPAVEEPVEELNNEELASFDTGFDDPDLPQEFEVVEAQPVAEEAEAAFETDKPTETAFDADEEAVTALEAEEPAAEAEEENGDHVAENSADADAEAFMPVEAAPAADDSEPEAVEAAAIEPDVSADDLVREAVSDIRADDLIESDISAEDLQGVSDPGFVADDFDPESLSEMNDFMTMNGEEEDFVAPKPESPDFGDLSAAGDPEDFSSVPEFGNTSDLGDLGPQDVTADDLTSQPEPLTAQAEPFTSQPEPFTSQPDVSEGDGLDDSGNQSDAFVTPGVNEDALAEQLNGILDQICAFFPEKNYPKFVGQIQRYVDERRFKILAKERNKEAVLSRIDKMEHPDISSLARTFYATLAESLNP